jgi:6-phosphogluconate dehydrogenase
MAAQLYKLGMVGLGTMGRSLVLNLADHGFAVAGYDRDLAKGQALLAEGSGKPVAAAENVQQFVAMLEKPRVVMALVAPAAVVDAVIDQQLPLLEPGDLFIDAGNSYYKDTDRRGKKCAEKGVNFFGMGVSGGEAGARYGPSMMPGGPKESYERVRPMLEAIAAKVNGEPCVAWVGHGSAGHYVKMVHNGMEYGIMQLIGEAYDLLHRGAGMKNDELQAVFDSWNKGEMNSFLLEITAQILKKKDDKGGAGWLVDKVKDVGRQKGTGKWTSQDAMDLQAPTPTIDMSVCVRDLSALAPERSAVGAVFGSATPAYAGDRAAFVTQVGRALNVATIISYAQGLESLRHASAAYKYDLNLAEVAKIWRGGCIIRSALLEDIRVAFSSNPNLANLVADPRVAPRVKSNMPALRETIRTAVDMGIPVPCMMASLGYFDLLRASSLPTNLTQAQRDFFGAHTYERTDMEGTFHSHWDQA